MALWTYGKHCPSHRKSNLLSLPSIRLSSYVFSLERLFPLTAADPDQPNAEKVKEIMLHFERVVIGQYELLGNRLSRDMYDNLPLPWEVSPPVHEFSKSDYIKNDYDRDGILTNGKTFFSGGRGVYSPILVFISIAPPGFQKSSVE